MRAGMNFWEPQLERISGIGAVLGKTRRTESSGDDGNVGIIRRPVRAIVLPDRQRVCTFRGPSFNSGGGAIVWEAASTAEWAQRTRSFSRSPHG